MINSKKQSPRQDKPKEAQAKQTVIKVTKIKDKDKILKVTRQAANNIKGNSHKVDSLFLNRSSASQMAVA